MVLECSNLSPKTFRFKTGTKLALPSWIKIKYSENADFHKIAQLGSAFSLHSVCQSAHCPNRSECWSQGTATFMVMGEICTRGCRFCAIKTSLTPPALDSNEPENLSRAIKSLNLKYVVITSVARDDLSDEGSLHIAQCIRAIKKYCPSLLVEVLVPDFKSKSHLIQNVVDAKPDVVSHNLETVSRLTPLVRDQRAKYFQSLDALNLYRKLSNEKIITKSGLMVGFGEKESEIEQSMFDLLNVGVEILTIGQYLSPSNSTRHLPVSEYVSPDQFKKYEKMAYDLGFKYVASGPLVRSSYKAAEPFIQKILATRSN